MYIYTNNSCYAHVEHVRTSTDQLSDQYESFWSLQSYRLCSVCVASLRQKVDRMDEVKKLVLMFFLPALLCLGDAGSPSTGLIQAMYLIDKFYLATG